MALGPCSDAHSQPAVVQFDITPHAVELREVPVPEIGDDDVLLAVGAVSVCGSDVHQAHGTHSWPVNVPVTLGHEFGGTIARAGRGRAGLPGGRPRRQRDGRRDLRHVHDVPERALQPLSVTQGIRLRRRRRHGGVRQGAGAMSAPRARRRSPFELACLAEPHAVAYNAMCVNVTIRPGDLVVVLGPGPIGLLCARMAALSGAHPLVVVGLTPTRRGSRPRVRSARRTS